MMKHLLMMMTKVSFLISSSKKVIWISCSVNKNATLLNKVNYLGLFISNIELTDYVEDWVFPLLQFYVHTSEGNMT